MNKIYILFLCLCYAVSAIMANTYKNDKEVTSPTDANIFGHVHGNPLYTDVSRQSFCVSAEKTGYIPLEFEEITEKMQNAINPEVEK